MLACIAAAILLGPQHAQAQDPTTLAPAVQRSSSFPKQSMVGPSRNIDRSQPLYLQGDELVYDTEGNRVIARGNVEIYYNDYVLTADEVVYNQSANTLTAVGNVVLKEPNGNVVRADRYTLTDDFRDGFVQYLSVVTSDDSRIAAEHASRRGGNTTVFTNGRFTPCKSDDGMPPLWCISAATIIHDQQAATISYQDAQFELFGAPVLYTPYFEHADPSVKRKSGFLTPEFSSNSVLGTGVGIPYYFALAPNYDFTFNPIYWSQQGVLLQGEWRHRLENGQYYIKLAGIDQNPNDLPGTIVNPDQYGGFRGSIETKGLFNLASWWHFGWDVTAATDDTFRRFYKLDNILATDVVDRIFLNGISERNYFSLETDAYISQQFIGSFETAQINKAYSYPILDYNYVTADPWVGGELRWNTNALSFSADQNPTTFAPLVNGATQMNRLVTEIDWRKRFIDPIGLTYTPFAQLRGDLLQASNFVDPQDPQGATQDTSVARGLALAGLTISYPWVANASYGSHVIEPIGQIIVRQASINQAGLPDYDAQSLVFDDSNLFDWNKFSGYDRIETGTRANVGLQYTFQANYGGSARILAGESFQLAGVNAYANPGLDANGNPIFSPVSGLQETQSDYVLGVYLQPFVGTQLISQSRFLNPQSSSDQRGSTLQREDAGAQLTVGPVTANALYSFLGSDPAAAIDSSQQQVSGQVGLRITDRWSASAAATYDLTNDQLASDMVQVRYADECFVLTASYTDNLYHNPTIIDGQTIMLRFELKYLGQFGYSKNVSTLFNEQQAGGGTPQTP
ncbi:MAG TPA: LPS-assembly protein LptD [Hyphomicrobium sp.]|nr:LPS-assembly protein LptD [Hyphomicrobium sp.]